MQINEDHLFAVVGRLYIENQVLRDEIDRLTEQLAAMRGEKAREIRAVPQES